MAEGTPSTDSGTWQFAWLMPKIRSRLPAAKAFAMTKPPVLGASVSGNVVQSKASNSKGDQQDNLKRSTIMAILDWSQCPVVESVPGRRSGAWVFRNTRMPVATVFENLEVGSSIEEIIEQYDVTREQIQTVLEFAARSLDAPQVLAGNGATDAHPV